MQVSMLSVKYCALFARFVDRQSRLIHVTLRCCFDCRFDHVLVMPRLFDVYLVMALLVLARLTESFTEEMPLHGWTSSLCCF